MSNALDSISLACGWLYFLAWSFSYYPQAYQNYKRKSVKGLSFEFQAYNLTGFIFYTIYCYVNYFEQREYNRHESVKINDLAFSLHAFILTIVIVIQCKWWKEDDHAFSKIHAGIIAVLWLITIINFILAATGVIDWFSKNDEPGQYNAIEFFGYSKAFISFVKYTPQVYMNHQKQSVTGFSMLFAAADFTGATFSLLQQVVDVSNKDHWATLSDNIPKLLLAVEVLFFEVVIFVQRYALYKDASDKASSSSSGAEDEKAGHKLLSDYGSVKSASNGSSSKNSIGKANLNFDIESLNSNTPLLPGYAGTAKKSTSSDVLVVNGATTK